MNRERFNALKDLKGELERLQKRLEALKDEEKDELATFSDKSDGSDAVLLFLEAVESRVEFFEEAVDFLGQALCCLDNIL